MAGREPNLDTGSSDKSASLAQEPAEFFSPSEIPHAVGFAFTRFHA
jgi:hypothetical protein